MATVGVVFLLGFLVNYLRKSLANILFFVFAVLWIFSNFKMLYTGEMATFNVLERKVKILMET
jgi:hypothetical protein